jgi:hypothetical protein
MKGIIKLIKAPQKNYQYLRGISILIKEAKIVLDAGFTFQENQSFTKQIITKFYQKNRVPQWNLVPRNFYLFISHAHEDHYAGIYSIPKNKNFRLFIGKTTYDIIKAKNQILNLELPEPLKITFLEDKKGIKIGNTVVTPIAVKHNIPENYGFIIENSHSRILYFPDYREKFWERIKFKQSDILITDLTPPLSPITRGKFQISEIQKFLQSFNKIVFVDYGWDFDTIIKFKNIADLAKKKICLSPNLSANFLISNSKFLKKFPDATTSVSLNLPKENEVLVCDLSELKIIIPNCLNQKDLGIISNHYSLSNQPWCFFHPFKKECFLNIFEGGHIQGIELIRHLKKEAKKRSIKLILLTAKKLLY